MDLTGFRAQVVCQISRYHKDMLGNDRREQSREFGVCQSHRSRKVDIGQGTRAGT